MANKLESLITNLDAVHDKLKEVWSDGAVEGFNQTPLARLPPPPPAKVIWGSVETGVDVSCSKGMMLRSCKSTRKQRSGNTAAINAVFKAQLIGCPCQNNPASFEFLPHRRYARTWC